MKTTDELNDIIRTQKDINHYIDENESDLFNVNFVEKINQYIEECKISKSNLIKSTNIHVQYAYEILSGKKKASRDKILQFCLALKLDVTQTNHLLYSADCSSLYARSKRDACIIIALENNYSVLECNENLYSIGEEPLE